MPDATTSYLALRLSVDGQVFMQQVYQQTMLHPTPQPIRPVLAFRLAQLNARGAAFTTEWIGTPVLAVLPIFFALCAR